MSLNRWRAASLGKPLRATFRLVLGLAAAYLALVALLFAFQRDMIFVGMYLPDAPEPAAGFHEVTFPASDNTTLTTWFRAGAAGAGAILLFGGQFDSLSRSAETLDRQARQERSLMAFGYRGFEGRPGQPTEVALKSDALTAFDALSRRTAGPITVVGYSLGSGVAAHVAAHRDVERLILLAPYTSVAAVAQERFPIVPVDPLLKDRFDTMALVPEIEAPVLIIHGDADWVIDANHGRTLADAFGSTADLNILPGVTHDLFDDLPIDSNW